MGFETSLTPNEWVTTLFQPDTLMPDQYLETFRRRTHLEPEKRLMLAVLEDGVACFQKYVTARDGKGKNIFQETEEWILEGPSERLFSFANVCETLGLNADYLRQGLTRWKAVNLENRATACVYQLTPRLKKEGDSSQESGATARQLREVANR
jgi:hypothetical protein